MSANHPRDCWYVAATNGEISFEPLGRRLLHQPVMLYTQESGDVTSVLKARQIVESMLVMNGRTTVSSENSTEDL